LRDKEKDCGESVKVKMIEQRELVENQGDRG